MNCPFCNRKVRGLTGLQEALAFQKHLRRCRKNPRRVVISDDGHDRLRIVINDATSLRDALDIRHESGQ